MLPHMKAELVMNALRMAWFQRFSPATGPHMVRLYRTRRLLELRNCLAAPRFVGGWRISLTTQASALQATRDRPDAVSSTNIFATCIVPD
jgi:hypothetical protein